MAKPFQGIAFVSFLECSLFGVYKQANALIFKLMKAVEMRDESNWKSYASLECVLMKISLTLTLFERLSTSQAMKHPPGS